jgi:hypothetical protein
MSAEDRAKIVGERRRQSIDRLQELGRVYGMGVPVRPRYSQLDFDWGI